jgi:leader peptidase (prepilin peptidase)/N-methyltransferase
MIEHVGLFFVVAVFALGASIGSFLNVVICRVPVGHSILRPASRCPTCETPIRAWHNIPLFGWFIVRGKCVSCATPISLRYPLIELLVGLLAVAVFHQFSHGLLTPESMMGKDFLLDVVGPFILYLGFVGALVAVTFIDLDWFVIPDVISLPGIPLGICTATVAGHVIGVTWLDSVIGAALGAGLIITIIVAYAWLTGREGMGGGDWKLLGMIGAYLGWQALPLVLLLSSLQGIFVVLLCGRRFAVENVPPMPGVPQEVGAQPEEPPVETQPALGKLAIPFGPFLSLAACEMLLFGQEIQTLIANYLAFAP